MKNNFLFVLLTIGLLGGCSNESDAASFDCNKTNTIIEKKICGNSNLSKIDEQLSDLYRFVRKQIKSPNKLKADQKIWLRKRNKCKTDECLIREYKSRKTILLELKHKNYNKIAWAKKRKNKIIELLKDGYPYIADGSPSDNLFCHELLEDVKSLSGIEIMPPESISNSLSDPDVEMALYAKCPTIYDRSKIVKELKKPRLVLLYNVNIDNDVGTNNELVLVDHYARVAYPKFIKEIYIVNAIYQYFDIPQCEKLQGGMYVGKTTNFDIKIKPSDINFDTGIHGVMKYKNKNYIYNISDMPESTIFSIMEFSHKTTERICKIRS